MTVKISRIQQLVAEHYNSSVEDMKTRRRGINECWPRMVAMYLARVLTDKSYPEIGRHFGKHHSTVMNAVARIEKMIDAAPDIDEDIETIKFNIMT